MKIKKQKYQVKRSWDEELMIFVIKIVGSAVLFFIIAIGVDVYRFLN